MAKELERRRNLRILTPVGLSRRAGLALALFGAHVLLLFFPAPPPYLGGSLWSYVLGYLAVLLAAYEMRSSAASLARRWGRLVPTRRGLLAIGAVLGVLAFGLAGRWLSPELFARWTREEGLWEPLALLALLSSASLLFAAARSREGSTRLHLQLFAGGFVLLTLEEVDYFGIFGAMIGRVDGIYVGSAHDLIGLAAAGSLPVWVVAMTLVGAGLGLILLGQSGHFQPRRVARTVFGPRGIWLVGYALAAVVAQVEDGGAFYLFGRPRIEELMELTGSLLLLGFAAGLAGDAIARRDSRFIPAPRGSRACRGAHEPKPS